MTVYDTLSSHNIAAHRAIERLLERMVEVAERDPHAPVLAEATECAVTMLRAHHGYEDDLLLPLLRQLQAEGPWSKVHDEHERLAVLVARLSRVGATQRLGLLRQVRDLVVPHMAEEEVHLRPRQWRQWLGEEEARGFGKEVAAYNRAHLKPGTKLLPLIIYNLTPSERAAFTEKMPRFLVKGLVPFAFRPMWRPLRPVMTYAPRRLSPTR